MNKRILIIDDEKSIREALKELLEYEKYSVNLAEDGKSGLALLEENNYSLVFCDIKMPDIDGIEILETAVKKEIETPFVMISGHGTIETAVETIKKGAYDFLEKPPDLNRLLITLRNAIDKSDLVTETKKLKRKISKTRKIIGDSPVIEKVQETMTLALILVFFPFENAPLHSCTILVEKKLATANMDYRYLFVIGFISYFFSLPALWHRPQRLHSPLSKTGRPVDF